VKDRGCFDRPHNDILHRRYYLNDDICVLKLGNDIFDRVVLRMFDSNDNLLNTVLPDQGIEIPGFTDVWQEFGQFVVCITFYVNKADKFIP